MLDWKPIGTAEIGERVLIYIPGSTELVYAAELDRNGDWWTGEEACGDHFTLRGADPTLWADLPLPPFRLRESGWQISSESARTRATETAPMIPNPSAGYLVTWNNGTPFNTQFPTMDGEAVADVADSQAGPGTAGRIIRVIALDGASGVKVTFVPGSDSGSDVFPKMAALSAGDLPIELGFRFRDGFAFHTESATQANQVAIVWEKHRD